jgi:hypothetical protein
MQRRLILAALAALPLRANAVTTLSPGQVLRGRFIQERHLRGFDAPLRTQGRFVLAPNKGLIWQAETPFAITTVITAAGLVQEADGTETMRLPAARLPFLSRLYAMLSGALSGDWHALDPDFTVTRSGDTAHWQATLTPRHPDATGMPFTNIAISGTQLVDQVSINKPNGDTEQLTFLDQTLSNSPLSPEEATALALPRP